MPTMLGQVLGPGALGLVLASMLAAFMSTHDTYLLSWATVLTQDVVGPLFAFRGKELSDKQRILLIRTFIILIGIFLLVWGLWYEVKGTFWEYMALTGTAYASGAGAVLGGGLYWKRANATGAYCALIVGFAPAVINLTNPNLLPVSWAGFISFPLAAGAMILGSLIGPATRLSHGDAT
jgi:SSS family solute:Na+ symporter